ncbi:MAG: MOSC N-terminal beta barrel domain-containing protein [Pseudomonadota bacterium]
MPTVSELTLYPIKSCAGIGVREATLTRAGLCVDGVHDRQWMLVDADGQFLSQREHPRMALITPRLLAHALEVDAPGMPALAIALRSAPPQPSATRTVRVWDDSVPASDEGDASAQWFSQVIGRPCRLVRSHPDARRQASATWTGGRAAPTMFADGFPLLLAGAASLADLNEKLAAAGRAPLPMNRFRPNIVVDGIAAFEEDYVEHFAIGAARIVPVKPCARCPIPSVDQASGCVGPDPLDILQAYRRKAQLDDAICFGMNCLVGEGEGARLFVGQPVEAALAF